MVGHTHEDVNAMFGYVSTRLRKHDAITVPGYAILMCDTDTSSEY